MAVSVPYRWQPLERFRRRAGIRLARGPADPAETIDVPVLSVVGEFDNLFCPTSCAAPGSPASGERAYYPNAPTFQTYAQPTAGHVINLHDTAGAWFAVARGWLARHVEPPPRRREGEAAILLD